MEKDIMRNMKLVYYCHTCGKTHEDVAYAFDARDKSVKCDCGGFVVSPSGKVLMQIVPAVPVWKVDDGEVHRFAAKDIDELRLYYKELYGEELDDDSEITEVMDSEELNRKFIRTDDEPSRLISLKEAINEADSFPTLLCSSVW